MIIPLKAKLVLTYLGLYSYERLQRDVSTEAERYLNLATELDIYAPHAPTLSLARPILAMLLMMMSVILALAGSLVLSSSTAVAARYIQTTMQHMFE